ncbi:MAG: hypothetical protein V1647_03305 [Pseudomonadota bacterium]
MKKLIGLLTLVFITSSSNAFSEVATYNELAIKKLLNLEFSKVGFPDVKATEVKGASTYLGGSVGTVVVEDTYTYSAEDSKGNIYGGVIVAVPRKDNPSVYVMPPFALFTLHDRSHDNVTLYSTVKDCECW